MGCLGNKLVARIVLGLCLSTHFWWKCVHAGLEMATYKQLRIKWLSLTCLFWLLQLEVFVWLFYYLFRSNILAETIVIETVLSCVEVIHDVYRDLFLRIEVQVAWSLLWLLYTVYMQASCIHHICDKAFPLPILQVINGCRWEGHGYPAAHIMHQVTWHTCELEVKVQEICYIGHIENIL